MGQLEMWEAQTEGEENEPETAGSKPVSESEIKYREFERVCTRCHGEGCDVCERSEAWSGNKPPVGEVKHLFKKTKK